MKYAFHDYFYLKLFTFHCSLFTDNSEQLSFMTLRFLMVQGLAVGFWRLVFGCWRLAVGCWLLAVGCWPLAIGL
jgi:hypothetical protein